MAITFTRSSLLPSKLLLVLLICFFLLPSGANARQKGTLAVMQPSAELPSAELPSMDALQQQRFATTQPSTPYVTRTGGVSLDVDVFLPRTAETGQRQTTSESLRRRVLVFSLFPDRSFKVAITKEDRPNPNAYIISGQLETLDLATVTLTVTGKSYLLTLHDMQNATLYRVIGDSETGLGQVTEIDLQKLPPRQYAPPLSPPQP